MIKVKDLMYYMSRIDYIKVLEKNLCNHENEYYNLYKKFKHYEHLHNTDKKYRDNENGRWFEECYHGRLYIKYREIIKLMDKTLTSLIFIERTNYKHVCFDSNDLFMKQIEFYIININDITIEVVEQ